MNCFDVGIQFTSRITANALLFGLIVRFDWCLGTGALPSLRTRSMSMANTTTALMCLRHMMVVVHQKGEGWLVVG